MAILTGHEIKMQQAAGGLKILPFDEAQLGPNSYNVRLGDQLLVYTDPVLDMAQENRYRRLVIPPEGVVLKPGRLYLGSTVEWIECRDFVPFIEGRSSTARLGLFAHVAAGVGDVGFYGCLTFELFCVHPVRVYAGAEIAQVIFHTTEGLIMGRYCGKYRAAGGPVASKIYEEFEKEAE